ncbi:MAG: hypothetical protein OCD02_09970 [Spirochaetaceae bacterium]
MANKYISLKALDSLDTEVLNIIVSEPCRILCKNFDTEQHEAQSLNLMHKKKPFFWRNKESKWNYYILESDLDKYLTGQDLDDAKEAFQGFNDDYYEMVKMSDEKRIESLQTNKSKLKELELLREKDNEVLGEALVHGTTDTLMLNKAIFDDLMHLTPEKAKIKSKLAVDETSEIVKIASNLLSDYAGDFSIFSKIIEESNGSTVKHMTRVFVMTLSFFKYYNNIINSGYASKIRASFKEKYRPKYETLLPNVNYNLVTLEKVFKGGMRAIPELETNAIGVGFLLHDIGKQVDLEYFEGSEGYVKERIQAHVSNGFNELLKRTVYPPVVSAVAGFHHEYYGHKSGYGPLRDFISKRFPNGIEPEHCISYSLHEVYNGEAMCFFPAKMLELVDVYDALTDPGRKYRDPCKPPEAIKFIREHFLKDEIKLDPILFDIFELYLKDAGEV